MELHDLLRATLDFQRTWAEFGCAVRRTDYGAVLRDDRHPLVHMANLAWVARPPKGGVSEILADLEDEFHGGAVPHRHVHFEDAQLAFESQEALVAQGYRPVAAVALARLGVPSCITNEDLVVREVGQDASEEDFRAITQAIHAEAGYGKEESRQVLEVSRERAATVGMVSYVSYLRDEPAGTFSLWPRGTFAMVEDVATHPRFRMKGVGRTMIWEAGRQAIRRRCEWTVLLAAREDTPQVMYQTLGYRPVGEVRGFLRLPAQA